MAPESRRADVNATINDASLDLMAVYREVSGVSERAGAIVIVAFIEDSLSQAILSRFRALSPSEERDLIKGVQAPLNTLYAKIHVGYALSLYSVAAKKDLLILKDIRNLFAHQISARDFTDKNVVKLCGKLHYTAYESFSSGKPEKVDAREQFHDAANHIMTGLRFMDLSSFPITRIDDIPSPLSYPIRHSPNSPGASRKKVRVRPSRRSPSPDQT